MAVWNFGDLREEQGRFAAHDGLDEVVSGPHPAVHSHAIDAGLTGHIFDRRLLDTHSFKTGQRGIQDARLNAIGSFRLG